MRTAIVALLAASVAWAAPEKKTVFIAPFDTVLVNACSGEEAVHVFGEAHIVTEVKPKNNGTVVTKQKEQFVGEGVGEVSQAHYDYIEGAKIRIYDGVPPSAVHLHGA